jgi:hypothetical protein
MGKSVYSKVFVFLFLALLLSISSVSAGDNYDYYGLNPDDNVYTFNPGNSNDNSYENSYVYNHRVTRDSYVTRSFVRDNPWNGGNRAVRRTGYSDNVYGSGDSCSNHYNWYDCSGYPSTNYRYREVYHPYSWDSAYGEDEYTAQYYYQVMYDSNLGYYNWRY